MTEAVVTGMVGGSVLRSFIDRRFEEKRAGKNQPAHDNLLCKAFSIVETVASL